MDSANSNYERFKNIVNSYDKPCAVMSVEKTPEGKCGEVRIFAANSAFSYTGEPIEGELYTKFIPHETEFDDMCFKAAFNGELFHTYVNSTKMIGGWSENLILPLGKSEDSNVGYCHFIYDYSKDLIPDKFTMTAPKIAGMVVKDFLKLRQGADFTENLDEVMEDIREFSDALSTTMVSVDNAGRKAHIIARAVRKGSMAAGQLLSEVPFEMVESWSELIGDSDCFIMRSKNDIDIMEKKSPKWAELVKAEGAQSACLVPLYQKLDPVGYILVSDFDVGKVTEIKEMLELLSLFLSSEIANHNFIQRLEWLTSIDMLTGVRNRAVMNRVVDELDARLKYQKMPFGVVFCTMNGLRALNAENGYDAGNVRLEKAGAILREVFDNNDIFRSAGEEFAIISENIEEEVFMKKVDRLRELGSNPDDVHFAVGCATDTEISELRKALGAAHTKMLKDKADFYEKYPEKKRQ